MRMLAGTGSPQILNSPRIWFVYGAKTESDNLPTGTAAYIGRMYAELWLGTRSRDRARLYGSLLLSADFDVGSVTGEISNMQIRTPLESGGWTSRTDVPNNRFLIEGGEIENGQFSAAVRGEGASDIRITDDFEFEARLVQGKVIGEFYGPSAEETGGVISGSIDNREDIVVQGFLGGQNPNFPTLPQPEIELSTPITEWITRDFENNTVRSGQSGSAQVHTIRTDGDNGFVISYSTPDGMRKELNIEWTDFIPEEGTGYYHERDMDLYIWFPIEYNDDVESEYSSVLATTFPFPNDSVWHRSYSITGLETNYEDLPSGTATYRGDMYSDSWVGPNNNDRSFIKGDLELTADFDQSSIGGSITDVHISDDFGAFDATTQKSETDQFVISEGAIQRDAVNDDYHFTGVLRGEDSNASAPLAESVRGMGGTISGEFFGPAAEEVGGVITATRTEDNSTLNGWFVGDKEQ